MYEIIGKYGSGLDSISIFVGTGQCNAYCSHCAGLPLRKYAPKQDGVIDGNLISKTLRECYKQGARYLSISSSGEPTLSPVSVSKTLKLVDKLKEEGISFSPINLYSNGIRIGEDKLFSDKYLPFWRNLGLTTVYITVHSQNEEKNAAIYRVKSYPSLESVFSRIHESGLKIRANLVLSKRAISTEEEFVSMIKHLLNLGVNDISAWPIRDLNDKPDLTLSPRESELDRIEKWIEANQDPKHKIRLLRENSKIRYQLRQKLTLFPDGSLSNKWCNH